jgi:hypothetical protein
MSVNIQAANDGSDALGGITTGTILAGALALLGAFDVL